MIGLRERMLDAYYGQAHERTPIGIYSRYLPRGAREREFRNRGLGIIDYIPPTTLLAPPWHLYDEFLSPVDGAHLTVKRHWNGQTWIEQRTYETAVGSVWQESEKDEGGVGSEHIRKHYIASPEDYRTMTYLVRHAVFLDNGPRIQGRLRELGSDGVVLGRLDRSPYQKCLIELVGPERFLVDLHVDPEPVLELMTAMGSRMEEAFERALESPLEILWQPDNVTSHMTPPDAFETFLLPFYRKRAMAADAAGKRYLVHMDGKLNALSRLIDESGVHAVESFTLPDMGGDLSLAQARVLFPKAIPHPSLPSNWFVLSDDELRQRAGSLLEELRGSPSMLQVSEDIPPAALDRLLDFVIGAAGKRP